MQEKIWVKITFYSESKNQFCKNFLWLKKKHFALKKLHHTTFNKTRTRLSHLPAWDTATVIKLHNTKNFLSRRSGGGILLTARPS